MAIYSKPSMCEIEIIGADLSGDEGWTVWWAYADHEFNHQLLAERHRGIKTDPINQLRADDGTSEVMQAIADLPSNRVQGRENAVEMIAG